MASLFVELIFYLIFSNFRIDSFRVKLLLYRYFILYQIVKMSTRKIRPVSAKPSVSFGKFDDPTEQRISQDLLVTKYLEHYVSDAKKSNKTNNRSSKRYCQILF